MRRKTAILRLRPSIFCWALVEQKEGVVLPILQKLGVNLQAMAQRSGGCGRQAAQGSGAGGNLYQSGD